MSVPTDLKSKQQNQLNMQVREMSDEHCNQIMKAHLNGHVRSLWHPFIV